MAGAKLADTSTLRSLNAVAVEHEAIAGSQRAMDELAPHGRHLGVVTYIFGERPPVGGGRRARAHEQVIVAWMLELEDKPGRTVVFIQLPISAVADLPDVQVDREVADRLVDETRSYLGGLAAQGRFVTEAQEEIERLLRGES